MLRVINPPKPADAETEAKKSAKAQDAQHPGDEHVEEAAEPGPRPDRLDDGAPDAGESPHPGDSADDSAAWATHTETPRQAASRRNGALSRGPVSAEGKARSAQNAVTHGLTARTIVLPDEEPQEFNELLADLMETWRPEDEMEDYLVRRIAECMWRLDRCMEIEAELFESHCRHADHRMRGLSAAFTAGGQAMMRLVAYESTFDRRLHLALRQLIALQTADGRRPRALPEPHGGGSRDA